MSDPLIAPQVLTPDDFFSFASTWKKLVNPQVSMSGVPTLLTLQDVFAVYGFDSEKPKKRVMNYVYLNNEYAVALLSAVGTMAIQVKFVVAPTDGSILSDYPAVAFTIVLFGIDGFGNATTAYYLAGVASYPAAVTLSEATKQSSNTNGTNSPELGPDLAGNWITNWNTLPEEGLTIDPSLFNSMYGPVLGYTYPLNDFMDALFPARMSRLSKKKVKTKTQAQALWLNFALHRHNKPGAIDDSYSYTFSTVLTLNALPMKHPSPDAATSNGEYVSGDINSRDSYYDVSRPSPPY